MHQRLAARLSYMDGLVLHAKFYEKKLFHRNWIDFPGIGKLCVLVCEFNGAAGSFTYQ